MRLIRWLASIVGLVLLVGAVFNELGKEPEKRTGQGTVADLVPYDFRLPTWERLEATFWQPDGRIFTPAAFGVGWTINLGRLARLAGLV